MPKLPLISGRDAVKVFCKIGYHAVRQRGSHIRLYHDNLSKKRLTIPDHKILGKGLLRVLIRDADITVKQFCELM